MVWKKTLDCISLDVGYISLPNSIPGSTTITTTIHQPSEFDNGQQKKKKRPSRVLSLVFPFGRKTLKVGGAAWWVSYYIYIHTYDRCAKRAQLFLFLANQRQVFGFLPIRGACMYAMHDHVGKTIRIDFSTWWWRVAERNTSKQASTTRVFGAQQE